MRVLILGGDGFCGWPTALHFAARGHAVGIVDNLSRRKWDDELGTSSLVPIASIEERITAWRRLTGQEIAYFPGDLTDYAVVNGAMDFEPDAIVHYGEQRSAPYSMIDREHAVFTQVNNVVGTLNVLFAMRDRAPNAHLIKLGTMGEYGTPNIAIEEGYLEIEHEGRHDLLPYPKQPGSIYHLCYDDQTEVLTRAGWKLFQTLAPEDEIATRQLTDARLAYEKPNALTSYLYEGPMYCLEQRRIDLRVTPNHRMVTSYKRRDGTEAMRFEEAKDILGKYNRYHLTTEWEGEEQSEFILPAYDFLDGGYIPTHREAKAVPMDDWLTFLGWYLAEGCIDGPWRKKAPNRISAPQNAGLKSEQVSAAFEAVAGALGCTHSVYRFKDREMDSHYLFCTQLAVYLRQFGTSLDKRIPRELLGLSKRQLRILFDAMMAGDGTMTDRDRHYCRYYTSSKQLADDVQEIAIKLGLSANISRFDRSLQGGWSKAPEYRVNIVKTTVLQVNELADDPNDWTEDYTGMVYCCEVPGDGIIMVRRHGKPVWCGNSKVHDSANILFACRTWGLRATDLNQGVVYNVTTEETARDDALANRFDYDGVFGTALNRFCAQAVAGHVLTVHGAGGQTRGFLDIHDTVRCVELAALHPAEVGTMRVFNQFTEQFSVLDLAERVCRVARTLGLDARLEHVPNPRVEKEQHFYQAKHTRLLDLGLEPHVLSDDTITHLLQVAMRYRDRIDLGTIPARVRWSPARETLDG